MTDTRTNQQENTSDNARRGEASCSPIRVQRRRVKGWRKPENTVCVDRTTKWGNPFKADWPEGGKDRAWAASAFRGYYHDDAEYRAAVIRALRGKNLACFCSLDGPCHADVLIEWANVAIVTPHENP